MLPCRRSLAGRGCRHTRGHGAGAKHCPPPAGAARRGWRSAVGGLLGQAGHAYPQAPSAQQVGHERVQQGLGFVAKGALAAFAHDADPFAQGAIVVHRHAQGVAVAQRGQPVRIDGTARHVAWREVFMVQQDAAHRQRHDDGNARFAGGIVQFVFAHLGGRLRIVGQAADHALRLVTVGDVVEHTAFGGLAQGIQRCMPVAGVGDAVVQPFGNGARPVAHDPSPVCFYCKT